MDTQQQVIFVLVVLAAGFISYRLLLLPKGVHPTTGHAVADSDEKRERLLQEMGHPRPAVKSEAVATKSRYKDVDIPEWSSHWRLPRVDNGSFIFTATKPNGLVIGLRTEMGRFEDAAGYGIVLDNGDGDRPESWIGKLPYYNQRVMGSKVNQGFQMPIPPASVTLWVAYRGGDIWVGRGSRIGHDVILAMQDPSPTMGIKYFGFGSLNKNIGFGTRGVESVDGYIRNILVCQDPVTLEIPQRVTYCQQNPRFLPQPRALKAQQLNLEAYYPAH